MAENQLRGKCECGFIVVVAYLPMPLAKAAELAMNARCPKCASSKIFVADDAEERADLPSPLTMQRGDRLIIDDPIETAESTAERMATTRMFREAEQTRADGGAGIVMKHTNIAGAS